MPEFEFDLQKVLQVREIREDKAQNQFLQARKQKKEKEQELNQLHDKQEKIYDFLRNKELKLEGIIQARDYMHNNRHRIKNTRRELKQKMKKMRAKKKEMVEKRKKRQVLDNLKEKEKTSFYKELLSREQKEIDEIAVTYHSGGLL